MTLAFHGNRKLTLIAPVVALCIICVCPCALAQEEGPMGSEAALRQTITELESRIAQLESGPPSEPAAGGSGVNPTTGGTADTAPDPLQFESIVDRIAALEANTEALSSLETEFLETPSSDAQRSTTGRLHLDYWAFPRDSTGINTIEGGAPSRSPQDRFELRRIRIGIRGTVPPENVTYQLDLEFSGVDQVQVRDAWIGLAGVPVFDTIRIGNQKRPYGLDQLNSSNFTVFIERPLVIEAVNDPNRRLGVQAFGATADNRWNWRYGVFHQQTIEDTGVISNDKYQPELAGRLATTPWFESDGAYHNYLHLGVANSFAFPARDAIGSSARFRARPEARTVARWLDTGNITGTDSYQLLIAEAVLNLGPVQFGGEYVGSWMQRGTSFGPSLFFQGGYVYASWFLTGESLPWNRTLGILGRVEPNRPFIHAGHRSDCASESGAGAWQVAARLSATDFNDDNVFGGRGRSATLAVNWYWNSHTRLQFNYIVGQIEDRMEGGSLVSGDYQIAGTRLMIDY